MLYRAVLGGTGICLTARPYKGVVHPYTESACSRRSSLKGWKSAIISQMDIGTISMAMLGKLPRDGVEHLWAFLSTQIPSWTELNIGVLWVFVEETVTIFAGPSARSQGLPVEGDQRSCGMCKHLVLTLCGTGILHWRFNGIVYIAGGLMNLHPSLVV